ncbi:MAG TPA: hypothetical protein VMW87_04485 [Spirochaetia bacterium]|nr:hypothetical protein [Spirochaetia bacterium]
MDENELEARRNELLAEIAEYNQEKERIKKMLASVGGTAFSRRDAAVNIVFLVIVVALFLLSIAFHLVPTFVSLEIGVLLVSVKVVWMIYSQHRFNHFLFWILHSLEYRVNEIAAAVKETAPKRPPADSAGGAQSSGQ